MRFWVKAILILRKRKRVKGAAALGTVRSKANVTWVL